MNRRDAIKGIFAAPLAGQGSLSSSTITKHFVEFYCPDTLVAETTAIESWDVQAAMEMARGIKERHAGTPYAFQFITRERGPEDLDSHESERSPMYYLGGKVETLAEMKARNDPDEAILVSNMECNNWDRVVTNYNPWKWTQPLKTDDVVLDFTP
ncbi:MAG: hypothetical protein LLG01_00890 [Planctomycetaceae bacterium]|nr:hypothetical protein [Planctomycetaceae bacterium]